MGKDPNERIFAFGPWVTPFANTAVELHDLSYTAHPYGTLTFRVRTVATQAVYRVSFETVSAFRVIDEHGLMQLWERTAALGGRPALTTFKVRNSHWTMESPLTFLGSKGWTHVVATDLDCIEIVAAVAPDITGP